MQQTETELEIQKIDWLIQQLTILQKVSQETLDEINKWENLND